jgi:hypothetical protein
MTPSHWSDDRAIAADRRLTRQATAGEAWPSGAAGAGRSGPTGSRFRRHRGTSQSQMPSSSTLPGSAPRGILLAESISAEETSGRSVTLRIGLLPRDAPRSAPSRSVAASLLERKHGTERPPRPTRPLGALLRNLSSPISGRCRQSSAEPPSLTPVSETDRLLRSSDQCSKRRVRTSESSPAKSALRARFSPSRREHALTAQ